MIDHNHLRLYDLDINRISIFLFVICIHNEENKNTWKGKIFEYI